MKLCLHCRSSFESATWACAACGHAPIAISGVTAFAPDLAEANDGFDGPGHERLDQLQEASFWFTARNRLIVALMRRHFPGARQILEVGCGTGFVLRAIAEAFPEARLVGSEIHASGLPYAARRLRSGVELLQMDARHIPYSDEFDVIGAFDVLEHVQEDEDVLREMHRATSVGGGILLTVPQHPWLWSRADDVACHKRRYRRGELADKCRRVGFSVEFNSSFVSSLLPVMLLQRLTSGRRKDYDMGKELALPTALNKMFEHMLDAERRILLAGLPLGAGGSRVVVARRLS